MNGLRRGGIYTHNGILLSDEKEQNNAICSNMDATRESHTNWSKSERKIPYDTTYMWNLNIVQINWSTKQKWIQRHGEQTCGCQRGEGRKWDGLGVWVSRCKLLHLDWVNKKVLLYSTGTISILLG